VTFPSPLAEFRRLRATRRLWVGVEPERQARITESVKRGEAVDNSDDAELAVALAGLWRDMTSLSALGARAAQAEEANRGLLWVNLYGSVDGTRKAA
jgi:hypothetical protein